MPSTRAYPAIDLFRMVAAFLVVAIHTAPFASVGAAPDNAPFVSVDLALDDALTYTLGRIAVPFFLATTGFFLLGAPHEGPVLKSGSFRRQMKKLCALYGIATVLYVPISLYAGTFPASIPEALQSIVFEGTFYHLWYFPAAILGCAVTALLLDRFGVKAAFAVATGLFAIGIFGDSYYGVTQRFDAARMLYESLFALAPHTRNGLFYAPMFLMIGVVVARKGLPRTRLDAVALAVSLGALLVEGAVVHGFGLDRHDSMYFMLVPVTYFLMNVLVSVRLSVDAAWARDLSLWIYILHPLCIVAVRGAAKVLGTTELIVGNSLVFFEAVCATSIALSLAVAAGAKAVQGRRRRGRHARGR